MKKKKKTLQRKWWKQNITLKIPNKNKIITSKIAHEILKTTPQYLEDTSYEFLQIKVAYNKLPVFLSWQDILRWGTTTRRTPIDRRIATRTGIAVSQSGYSAAPYTQCILASSPMCPTRYKGTTNAQSPHNRNIGQQLAIQFDHTWMAGCLFEGAAAWQRQAFSARNALVSSRITMRLFSIERTNSL